MNASVKKNTPASTVSTQQNSTLNSAFSSTLIASTPLLAQTPSKQPINPLVVKSWTGFKPDKVKILSDVIIDPKTGKKITVSYPLYKDNNLNHWTGYFTLDRLGKRVDFDGVPESAASTDARISTITQLVKTGRLEAKNIIPAASTAQTSAQRHDQTIGNITKKGLGIDTSTKANSVKTNYNLGISFAMLEMVKGLFEKGEAAKNLTTEQKTQYGAQIQASIEALKAEARKQGYNDTGWASALGNAGFNVSAFFLIGEKAIGPVLSKLGQIPKIGKGITVAAAVAGLAGAGDQLKNLVLELRKGEKADKTKILNDLGNIGLLAFGLKGLLPKKSRQIVVSKAATQAATPPRIVAPSVKEAQQILQRLAHAPVGTQVTKGGIKFERVTQGVRITEIASGKSRLAAIQQDKASVQVPDQKPAPKATAPSGIAAPVAKRSGIAPPSSKPSTAKLAASKKPAQKALPPAKQDKGGAIVLAAKPGALVAPPKVKMPTGIKLRPLAGSSNANTIVPKAQTVTMTLEGQTIVISRHNGKTTARVSGGEAIEIPSNVSAKGNGVIAHFALAKHQSMQTKDLSKSTPNQTVEDLNALKKQYQAYQLSPAGQKAKQELKKVPTMMAEGGRVFTPAERQEIVTAANNSNGALRALQIETEMETHGGTVEQAVHKLSGLPAKPIAPQTSVTGTAQEVTPAPSPGGGFGERAALKAIADQNQMTVAQVLAAQRQHGGLSLSEAAKTWRRDNPLGSARAAVAQTSAGTTAATQPATPEAPAAQPQPNPRTAQTSGQTSTPSLIDHMSETTRAEFQRLEDEKARHGYFEKQGNIKDLSSTFFEGSEVGEETKQIQPSKFKSYRPQSTRQLSQREKERSQRAQEAYRKLESIRRAQNELVWREINYIPNEAQRLAAARDYMIVKEFPGALGGGKRPNYAIGVNSSSNADVYDHGTNLNAIKSNTFYRIKQENGEVGSIYFMATSVRGTRYSINVDYQVKRFQPVDVHPLTLMPSRLVTSPTGNTLQQKILKSIEDKRFIENEYNARSDGLTMKAAHEWITQKFGDTRRNSWMHYILPPKTNPFAPRPIPEQQSLESIPVGTIYRIKGKDGKPLGPLQLYTTRLGRPCVVNLEGLVEDLKTKGFAHPSIKTTIPSHDYMISKYFSAADEAEISNIISQRQTILVGEREVKQSDGALNSVITRRVRLRQSNLPQPEKEQLYVLLKRLHNKENYIISHATPNMSDPAMRYIAYRDQMYLRTYLSSNSNITSLPKNLSIHPLIINESTPNLEIPSAHFFKIWKGSYDKNGQWRGNYNAKGEKELGLLQFTKVDHTGSRTNVQIDDILRFEPLLNRQNGTPEGFTQVNSSMRSTAENDTTAKKNRFLDIQKSITSQVNGLEDPYLKQLINETKAYLRKTHQNNSRVQSIGNPLKPARILLGESLASVPLGEFVQTYKIENGKQVDVGALQLTTASSTLRRMTFEVPGLIEHLKGISTLQPHLESLKAMDTGIKGLEFEAANDVDNTMEAAVPQPTPTTPTTPQPSAPPALERNPSPQQSSTPQGNIRAETRDATIRGRNTQNIGQRAVDSFHAQVIQGTNTARIRNRKAAQRNAPVTQPTQAAGANRPQVIVHSLNPQDGFLSALNYTVDDIVSADPRVFLNKYRPSMTSFAPHQLKSLKVGAINEYNETAQFDIDALSNETAKNALMSARQQVQSLVRNTANRNIILPLQGKATTYVVNSTSADAANVRNSIPIGHFYNEIASSRQGSARDVTVCLMYKTCNSNGEIVYINMN